MTNEETIAIAKSIKAAAVKIASSELDAGEFNVDFMVHIFGSGKKGKNYQSKPTVAIPYKAAFAALCHVAGCTGKAGVNMMRKAMEIALADDNDVTAKDALQRFCPMVDQVENDVIEPMLAELPKLNCNGKITMQVEVEIEVE